MSWHSELNTNRNFICPIQWTHLIPPWSNKRLHHHIRAGVFLEPRTVWQQTVWADVWPCYSKQRRRKQLIIDIFLVYRMSNVAAKLNRCSPSILQVEEIDRKTYLSDEEWEEGTVMERYLYLLWPRPLLQLHRQWQEWWKPDKLLFKLKFTKCLNQRCLYCCWGLQPDIEVLHNVFPDIIIWSSSSGCAC